MDIDFNELLMRAQRGDMDAREQIFTMYRPLLIRKSFVDGRFDEDLFQEVSKTLIICIHRFSPDQFKQRQNKK